MFLLHYTFVWRDIWKYKKNMKKSLNNLVLRKYFADLLYYKSLNYVILCIYLNANLILT